MFGANQGSLEQMQTNQPVAVKKDLRKLEHTQVEAARVAERQLTPGRRQSMGGPANERGDAVGARRSSGSTG